MQGNPELLAETVSSSVSAAIDGGHISHDQVPQFAASIIRKLAPMLTSGTLTRARSGMAARSGKTATKLARSAGAKAARTRGNGASTDQKPAVPIKRSITRDHIICLEDGKKMRTLTRYINGRYNLTPDQYRTKWGLPDDYPMTAPALQKLRSKLSSKKRASKKQTAKKRAA